MSIGIMRLLVAGICNMVTLATELENILHKLAWILVLDFLIKVTQHAVMCLVYTWITLCNPYQSVVLQ